MKRRFLFPILSLIFIASFSGPNLVSAATDSGAEYWTIEEMADLSAESLREAEELCKDSNRGCWQKYLRDRRERGGVYRALDSYEYPKFIITSVNPSKGKMKFIFYDEDKRAKYLGREDDPATLHSIYIGRIEGASDKNYSPWSDIENTVNGRETTRNIFMTFRWDSTDENHAELLPNVEQEVDVEDFELLPSINNSLYYIFEDSNSRYLEIYRLSDCLANYQEGMECQIRYSSDGVVYVPVLAETTALSPQTDSNDNLGELATQEPLSSDESGKSTAAEELYSEVLLPSTPDTGAPTYQASAMDEINPRGIIAIFLGGIMILWQIFSEKVLTKFKM